MMMMRYGWPKGGCSLLLLLGIGLALVRCAKPVTYGDFPLHQFLPLPIHVLEDKFQHEPFDILEAKATAHGSTSAVQFNIPAR